MAEGDELMVWETPVDCASFRRRLKNASGDSEKYLQSVILQFVFVPAYQDVDGERHHHCAQNSLDE